ncbi:hypothetical protein HK097_007787 [Rhizophlyctis rosea]|uniref:Homeobox domain-containing protein n=1 Tax=Rhizophlyctis rosea TaxID=64517 RepID=A0AAD5SLE6_9FUNG|nr:hypothetical protein HK097_007787 [Rhizophlyctis rosea]
MISSSPDIVYSTPLGEEAQDTEDCIPGTPPTTTTKKLVQRKNKHSSKSSRSTRQSPPHRSTTSTASRHQQRNSHESETENDPPPLPPPLNLTAPEDEVGPGMRDNSTRQNHPKTKIQILEKWFYDHLEYPYPTEREKEQLLEAAQMNKRQLENWFINARRPERRQKYKVPSFTIPKRRKGSIEDTRPIKDEAGKRKERDEILESDVKGKRPRDAERRKVALQLLPTKDPKTEPDKVPASFDTTHATSQININPHVAAARNLDLILTAASLIEARDRAIGTILAGA